MMNPTENEVLVSLLKHSDMQKLSDLSARQFYLLMKEAFSDAMNEEASRKSRQLFHANRYSR